MKYSVEFTVSAYKSLKKLDKPTRTLLLSWIHKNLIGCENPRVHGKALSVNHVGQWRYRAGDYRLIAEIQDDKVVILTVEVGHRREKYR